VAKKANRNTTRDWAMYVYIAGDNNLSTAGLEDIREMESAGASKDLHVAVQIDTAGEHDGSVRYEISLPDFTGKSHRTVIERLEEQNTGDPRFLTEFAKWAADRYPARNRLLVVWNHGAGFMHTPTRDIGYDDSSKGDALTMAELRLALKRAGFGKGPRGKLALLGFDACLMNMVEVAYEFMGLTDIVVGSQQTEPGDGWPYGDVVGGLHRRPAPKTAAANIVNSYDKYYRKAAQPNVTQSAIELARLPAVGKALDRLGSALLAALPDARAAIVEARVRTQGYEEPTYVDLCDLAHKLRSISGNRVRGACNAVVAAAKAAIIANKHYGSAVDRSKGLSIWFPLIRTDYATRRSEYVALRCTKDYPAWSKFLDRLLSS
jgi:hypothetical protein